MKVSIIYSGRSFSILLMKLKLKIQMQLFALRDMCAWNLDPVHVKIFSNFQASISLLTGSGGGFPSTGYAGNNACLLLVLKRFSNIRTRPQQL